MKPLRARLEGPFSVDVGESLAVNVRYGAGWKCGRRGWVIIGIQFADRMDELDPPKDAYRIVNWIQRSLQLPQHGERLDLCQHRSRVQLQAIPAARIQYAMPA